MPLSPPRRLALFAAACSAALALHAGAADAAQRVIPHDVTGTQRVLAVGCRFADTTSPDILNYANGGINSVLQHTHDYFDKVSNHRVDFQGSFEGWHTLPKSSGDYSADDGAEQTADCQAIAEQVLASRGERATDYAAVALLFNLDRGVSNATFPTAGHPGTWIRLRFTGGTGGGWTSEGLWAHEIGHAFGLLHSTFPTREPGNQYNDFQDAMSGYGHSAQHRWNFLAGGVCNGIAAHPRCIYAGEADNVPVHYSAFQKQRLGWLFDDGVATHWGGQANYQLSAPTYNPNHESTVQKLKLVEVKIPNSTAYYALEYRRGANDGADSDASAYRRGWDDWEKGIRSDRVTVYKVEPDLYAANAGDLGDANLVAVLNPGESFATSGLTVGFNSVEPGPRMNAFVSVSTPLPPAPETLISGDGRNGSWANHDVVASLLALQSDGGAPLARTYYGVDDAGCNEQSRDCAIYDGQSFTVAGEGTHDVTYFSSDVAGGAEVANHTTVRIDKTAPETAPSVATVGGGTQLTLSSTDALSGVAETDYAVDGGDFKPYNGPVTITKVGDHTVRFRASDRAGNFETPKSVSIHVDPPPTCTATASHSRIVIADGRLVAIHITVRNPAGTSIVLHGVARTTHGVTKDWQVGTSDVDGRVAAVPGVRYTFRYTVTDAAGRAGSCVARVTVNP